MDAPTLRNLRRPGGGVRVWLRLLVLVGLVLGDLLVGSLLLDQGTPEKRRLENSPAAVYDRARVAAIQRDGDGTRFVFVDGLWRLTPVASEFVNVDDNGVRLTTGGREDGARVAFLGGSAAFGVGQADDATIPSVLAALSNDGEIPVQVVNTATPGWTAYDAAVDLRARLQRGERFDVVIVYSGMNELALAALGRRVPETLVGVAYESAGGASSGLGGWWADRSAVMRLTGRTPRQPATPIRVGESPSSSSAGATTPEEGSPAALRSPVIVDAVFNYAEGDRLLRGLADEFGFDLVQVAQPARPGGRSWLYHALVQEYRRTADDLLDLSELLPDRCFFDTVHTTEPCSPLVAEALRDELAPVLAGLTASRSGPTG